MHVPFIDLRAQHDSLQPELDEALERVFRGGYFILGEDVERFEADFAAYCGARYAIGVASGLAALELSLAACGIGPGDEVITAANTFVASALAIQNVGATPVLVDADDRTANLDPAQLAAAITPRARAILPVHLYGRPADMDTIAEIARAHDLAIVEDACQAHGARFGARRVGAIGAAGCFSFYPTKNLGACGDGGIVVTDQDDIRDRVRLGRNYGQSVKYRSDVAGRNERLDTLQAAILGVKLKRLDAWNEARQRHAALYDQLLVDLPIARPQQLAGRTHVFHLYVVRTPRRDPLMRFLTERGVATLVHYPIPVHRQPALAGYPFAQQRFPVAERIAEEVLSLPIYPEMTAEQIEYVCAAVREFFSGPTGNAGTGAVVSVGSPHPSRS